MKESTRSILSATGLLTAICAVLAGGAWREHIDALQIGATDVSGLVASKDSTIGEVEFFREMAILLKREYVDPVTDDQKLASGAVRGMISSLGDLNSRFLDADALRVYQGMRDGHYEGIGVELTYRMEGNGPVKPEPADDQSDDTSETTALSTMRFPRLVVSNVVPGGPADKAGVKVGDAVSSVNGHWLVDAKEVSEFQEAQRKVGKGQMPRSEYAKIHRAIRLKVESSIMPAKARDRIISGTSGEADVIWIRNGKQFETKIEKAPSTLPVFAADGNAIGALTFVAGAATRLHDAISGKSECTIDLRHNVGGDYDSMRKCLAELLPAGQYGYIAQEKDSKPKPFSIGKGVASVPKIKLLVDNSTSGAAETFATILKKYAKATIVGSGMQSDSVVFQLNKLPDGTGYTLATGRYTASPPKEQAQGSRPRRLALLNSLGANS